MRNHIKEAIERTNLQDIREFLLYGVEECKHSNETFEIRLREGSNAIYERLGSLYPDEKEHAEATDDLNKALSTYESTFMEIGMKAGARLIYQLLLKD